MTNFQAGDRVTATFDQNSTGTVERIKGDIAMVRWDGARWSTAFPINQLRRV